MVWICNFRHTQVNTKSIFKFSGKVLSHSFKYSPDHDNVIKWKPFPRYWPFVRGIHRSPVNSPHKSQWRGALMFSLICVWIKNGWVNKREAGDLRRYRAHYDVIVMNFRPCKMKTAMPMMSRSQPCLTWFQVQPLGVHNGVIFQFIVKRYAPFVPGI